MRSTTVVTIIASAAIIAATGPSLAQSGMITFNGIKVMPGEVTPGVGQVMVPESSIAKPEDRGLRAHTNYEILSTLASPVVSSELRGAQLVSNSPNANTPASLACVYGLVPKTNGCDPRVVLKDASGGSQVIAIVDAFHNPTALADLKTFSTGFGLPAPKFQVIYCSSAKCGVSTPPPANQDWSGEISLDIQWAHAMAPHAKIVLVEANSNSYADFMLAEDAAAKAAANAGGGEVSNSWGGGEFGGQTTLDSHFKKAGVVFFASTGDHKCSGAPTCPDVEFPSTSPNVVGVGGTSIVRNSSGAFTSQKAWIDGGGGLSSVYSRPSFQNGVQSRVGNVRGVPDIAWLADPNTGAFVYCSAGTCGSQGGYFVFGGTSLASPAIAAMVNNAGKFRASSPVQNKFQYGGLGGARYTDIKAGQCGNGTGGALVNAVTGWDRCTGIGTPKGKTGL